MKKKKSHSIGVRDQAPDKKEYQHYLTIGRLKEFIKKHKIPDNALILHQRIEDVYFEKHGWSKTSIVKPCPEYPGSTDEYVVVFSFVGYKDKNLYLTAHY
jgi:hypothetical protein